MTWHIKTVVENGPDLTDAMGLILDMFQRRDPEGIAGKDLIEEAAWDEEEILSAVTHPGNHRTAPI